MWTHHHPWTATLLLARIDSEHASQGKGAQFIEMAKALELGAVVSVLSPATGELIDGLGAELTTKGANQIAVGLKIGVK